MRRRYLFALLFSLGYLGLSVPFLLGSQWATSVHEGTWPLQLFWTLAAALPASLSCSEFESCEATKTILIAGMVQWAVIGYGVAYALEWWKERRNG